MLIDGRYMKIIRYYGSSIRPIYNVVYQLD